MKRYCLVSFCNIYVLPYVKLYIDAITASDAECDLLYWDRDAVNGQNDKFECKKICYQRKMTPESSFKEKILGYIQASRFFKLKLQEHNYDGVIFLQTHAAIACGEILTQNYKGRYIVDIRDYTLEEYKIYKKFEKKVIDNSYATVVSSPAYSHFLPKHNYVIAHNYSPFPEKMMQEIRKSTANRVGKPIQISFVGTVRFIDMDKKILKLFANDERFKINYFGSGSDVLERFCEENAIYNVEFYGSFSPEMTVDFYKKTDVINNLYGNHNPFLDYALSNKLYHAGQLYLPILVCPDTYMEQVSTEYNMGFVFNVENSASLDEFYKWFNEIDRKILVEGCNNFISKVKEDNAKFNEMILDFLALN